MLPLTNLHLTFVSHSLITLDCGDAGGSRAKMAGVYFRCMNCHLHMYHSSGSAHSMISMYKELSTEPKKSSMRASSPDFTPSVCIVLYSGLDELTVEECRKAAHNVCTY